MRARVWPVATMLALCSLAGCGSGSPPSPADVIRPSTADADAQSYFDQRLKLIESDDEATLGQDEVPPAMTIDIQLAKEFAAAQKAKAHGPALIVEFPYAPITQVESFVGHQATYPATFLSAIKLKDGSAALMGFAKQTATDRWRLAIFVDVPKASDIDLAKGGDGAAPQPQATPYSPWLPDWVSYFLNTRCRSNPSCTLDPRQVMVPPAGYRPGIVSGEMADSHIANIAQDQRGYRAGGFSVAWAASRPRLAFSFPWYRRASGGYLGFVAMAEASNVDTGGPSKGCVTVSYQDQYFNALLPPGKYYHVSTVQDDLIAVAGPSDSTSGSFVIVGVSFDIAGSVGTPCS